MSELSPQARELIDRARGTDSPNASDRARIRAALAATLGAGAFAGPGEAAAAVGRSAAGAGGAPGAVTSLGLGTKLIVAVALCGVVTVSATIAYRSWSEAPAAVRVDRLVAAPVAAPVPAAIEMAVAPLNEAPNKPAVLPEVVAATKKRDPLPHRAHRAPQTPPPPPKDRAPQTKPTSPADSLAHERALLVGARTALRHEDAHAALAALRQHASAHPEGLLAEEREALMVEALCAAGKLDRARAHAKTFHTHYPDSVHTPRVSAACQTDPR